MKNQNLKYAAIGIAAILILCVAGYFLLRPGASDDITPLSAQVLQQIDGVPADYQWTYSSACAEYLYLAPTLLDVDTECYQVRFAAPDGSVQILHALWVYQVPQRAQAAFQSFAELLPNANGIVTQAVALPIPNLGMNVDGSVIPSAASRAVVEVPDGTVEVQNLYWLYSGAETYTLSRLTVISAGTYPFDDLVLKALILQGRIAVP